jgi:hypothetical protein
MREHMCLIKETKTLPLSDLCVTIRNTKGEFETPTIWIYTDDMDACYY